jgi:hypothetical protein
MIGAEWVDGLFAALLALVALYNAVRLLASRRGPDGAHEPDRMGHGGHLLMALGMVAMFVPPVDPLPPLVWVGIFVVFGAWIGAVVLRAGAAGTYPPERGHQIHLVISMVAMVYMFAAMTTPASEPVAAVALAASGGLAHEHAAGGANLAAVNIVLALYFLLHALWSGTRLVRPARLDTVGTAGAGSVGIAVGRLPDGCHLVMGSGMSYMFVTMVG